MQLCSVLCPCFHPSKKFYRNTPCVPHLGNYMRDEGVLIWVGSFLDVYWWRQFYKKSQKVKEQKNFTSGDSVPQSVSLCCQEPDSITVPHWGGTFFKKKIWRTSVFLWGHWYPCFGLLVTSALGFKPKLDPLACVLCCLHATESSDLPLVRYLLTSEVEPNDQSFCLGFKWISVLVNSNYTTSDPDLNKRAQNKSKINLASTKNKAEEILRKIVR